MRIIRPLIQAQTYRDLGFLALGIPVATAAFGLFVAGWTSIGLLAITPLVVPVLLGFRRAVGVLARVDARLARPLLGVDVDPPTHSSGRGFWGRAAAVLADPNFWRQQAYLLVRTTLGFALAVGELSLIAGALGWITQPIWYRWTDNSYGSWHVDTLGRAFIFVPAGLAGLILAGWLARALGVFSAWQVEALLTPRPRGDSRRLRRRALQIHGAVSGGIALLLTALWALTGHGGNFWPYWAIVPLALIFAIHAGVEVAARRVHDGFTRGVTIHGWVVAALFIFFVAIWAMSSRGAFWPGWTLLGLVPAVGVHYLLGRNRLARRVERLEETRAGAVEEQDAELRRIERDLHDGAQARLVALGLRLGMAEQKFRTDPEEAEKLVAEARAGVAEAIRELRDLSRGIYPPVLADRGIGAALASLADRSPLPTTVAVELAERPPPAVETAAYFVAAEALANATKHSGADRIDIRVTRGDGRLEVAVTDDGKGGADAAGSGLVGLRRRVEALDGTLSVDSPEGGPTTIRAELPCGS
jgi:signal transduction histidine kinase